MDKSSWDSNAIFIFFCHSRFPHKTVCHPFHNYLAVLPPPTLYKVETQKKFWIHESNIVCGVRGGVGPVRIGKLPEMQKCPKTCVHDCSVILAGKCGSHCHSTTSFSKNIVVAETIATYQILEVLSLCDQERDQPPSINKTELSLLVNQKYNGAFQGDCLFFAIIFVIKIIFWRYWHHTNYSITTTIIILVYSQLFLSRTPLGPVLSVRPREVSVS